MEPFSAVFWFALASLLAWGWLLCFHGGFWRADQRLGEGGEASVSARPTVAVVIPARNEADVIGPAVSSILAQRYDALSTIIVVDDGSSDGTSDAIPADPRVRVVTGTERPARWTGKIWAVSQGVDAIPATDYVWLTDADIHHDADELTLLVQRCERERLDLMSVMVRLRLETFWDRLLIPAFVFFFQKLYPFRRVNDPADRMAAAAGGSMLVRRSALDRIGGIAAIRNELIDDCALAAAIKGSGGRIRLVLSESTESLRAYGALGEIWRMVARAAFHQLRYSPFLLAGTVSGMTLLYLLPPLALLTLPLHGDIAAAICGASAWTMMAWAEAPTLYRYGLNPWRGFLLPLAGLLYTFFTLDSARRHWLGRGGVWKGRTHAP